MSIRRRPTSPATARSGSRTTDRRGRQTPWSEAGWLHRHRHRWSDSGLPWREYLRSWAAEEGLHTGEQILAGLDARFHRRMRERGPYFFADLADTTEAEEQAAIDNADIQANGIRYVGQPC